MKKIFFNIVLFLILVIGITIYYASNNNILFDKTVLPANWLPYADSESKPTQHNSRLWIAYALHIVKNENLPPVTASRFYAYVSSVYYETLKATKDSNQAKLATHAIIVALAPEKNYPGLYPPPFPFQNSAIYPQTRDIISRYEKRIQEDNYSLLWDKKIPPGKYRFILPDNSIDKDAMSGQWKRWIISSKSEFHVPPPPQPDTFLDSYELEKIKYATITRSFDASQAIYFWDGEVEFSNLLTKSNYNITLAGVWLNILFIEKGEELSDLEFAKAQQILSQSIADSFIEAWKVKYTYYNQRPSTRIPNLPLTLPDPPYPSYISEHATVSQTAYVVLSGLFPEKEKVWHNNMTSAKNSLFLAGMQFDADIQAGSYLGMQLGKEILKILHLGSTKTHDQLHFSLTGDKIISFLMLRTSTTLHFLKEKFISYKELLPNKKSFENVILKTNIHKPGFVSGISLGDYNNDGFIDLFLGGVGGNKLFRNKGNNTFTETTRESNIQTAETTTGVFGDFNNDGCIDTYIVRHGQTDSINAKGNSDILQKNNCDGTFTDITKEAGIIDDYHGVSAAWGDYNNDGFLDVYVTNFGIYKNSYIYSSEPNILYKNNGNGTFTNSTEDSGVIGIPECQQLSDKKEDGSLKLKLSQQAVWFDYNNDNNPDLFVANDGGISVLYKNNGDGTFSQVTKKAGLCKEGTGMGVSIADFDNNNFQDIYVTNVGLNYLWKNNGDGTFTQIAEKIGIDKEDAVGWGTHFFDYDNDSDLDLYAINGIVGSVNWPVSNLSLRDYLYINDGNGIFKEVGIEEGLTSTAPKEAGAFGDFDNNGTIDIFIADSTRDIGYKRAHHLYKNNNIDNNWITIKLIGTKSNRDAVGAKIKVISNNKVQTREIISGSSYSSQNSLWQTFGLGKAKKVDKIEISWPSGIKTIRENIKPNQILTIKEN